MKVEGVRIRYWCFDHWTCHSFSLSSALAILSRFYPVMSLTNRLRIRDVKLAATICDLDNVIHLA